MRQLPHHSQNGIIPAIYDLGVMNQLLIHKSLDIGLLQEARELQSIDQQLLWLLHKTTNFDFVTEIGAGRTLLVGEGNFSFALSLSKMSQIVRNRLVATSFEKQNELPEEAAANVAELQALGVTVIFGVDATELSAVFGSWLFNAIVFQFPHAGSREPVEGHNPNFILVRDFLVSCASQLQHGGRVFISAVDSSHYQGAFQFEEAAEIAGFSPPEVYAFDPDVFPGYEHSMTHQTGSALENHDAFATWVFRRG